jgi:hypothetical protein
MLLALDPKKFKSLQLFLSVLIQHSVFQYIDLAIASREDFLVSKSIGHFMNVRRVVNSFEMGAYIPIDSLKVNKRISAIRQAFNLPLSILS